MRDSSLDAWRRRYGGDSSTIYGGVAWHPHDAADISGVFSQVTVSGDIWSTNWNGGVPADLSAGAITAATAGFYLDASAGAAQFEYLYSDHATISGAITATSGSLANLTVAGTLSLSGSGKIESAATGQRAVLLPGSGSAWYALRLYTGEADDPFGFLGPYPQSGVQASRVVLAGPTIGGHYTTIMLTPEQVLFTADSYLPSDYWAWWEPSGSVLGSSLNPGADNTYDLGSADYSWCKIYGYAVYDEAGSCYIDLSGLSLVNPSNSRIQAAAALAQLDTYEGSAFQARVAAAKGGNVTVYDCDGHIRQRWTDEGIVSIRLADETVAFQVDASGSDPVRVYVGSSLKSVTAGASDSGGTGYKLLRVPN